MKMDIIIKGVNTMSNMDNFGNANFNYGMSQLIINTNHSKEFQALDIDTRLKVMEILDKTYKELLKEVQLP